MWQLSFPMAEAAANVLAAQARIRVGGAGAVGVAEDVYHGASLVYLPHLACLLVCSFLHFTQICHATLTSCHRPQHSQAARYGRRHFCAAGSGMPLFPISYAPPRKTSSRDIPFTTGRPCGRLPTRLGRCALDVAVAAAAAAARWLVMITRRVPSVLWGPR